MVSVASESGAEEGVEEGDMPDGRERRAIVDSYCFFSSGGNMKRVEPRRRRRTFVFDLNWGEDIV